MDSVLIAHAGHWIVNVAYFVPVLGFLIWLLVVTVRNRRQENDEFRAGPRS